MSAHGNLKHGMCNTAEYGSWIGMKRRCYTTTSLDYPDYGGRGITICDRWLNSFENFFEDMGAKPSPSHSIERIENDKGYYKSNCKWATKIEQARNRRVRKDSKSGVTGVTWVEDRNKWRAVITVDKKKIHLGRYKELKNAIAARKSAEENYFILEK